MSMQHQLQPLRDYRARHFRWDASADGRVATVTLDRPEKKNPLTFDAYAELRDLFRALVYASDVRSVVVTGAGGNFCSGGDVHEIIGPLTKMTMPELLAFTRMTGDLVKAMRHCPQPIVAAIDGICAGAGAMIALASDFRLGTPAARTAFLFTRVGLAGCDMGACTLLPRMIGQGRAAELLYTGRAMTADEGAAWGFFNRLVDSAALAADAEALARSLADGPAFAHAMTKKLLHQEWAMDLDAAIEAEAEAQAICMQTQDFRRAYDAFVAKTGRSSRATDADSSDGSRASRLAFLRRPAPRARDGAWRMVGPGAAVERARRCRSRMPPPRAPARRRRLAALLRPGGARRCAPRARRAVAVHRAGDARLARRACRLCLCDAGPRQRRDHPGGHGCAEGALASAGRSRERHRGIRAVGARSRVRRRGDDLASAPRRRRPCPRRRQDVHLERRHRRFLLRVRAHRRRRWHARHLGVRRARRRARAHRRRADRYHRAAPAGAARIQGMPARRRRAHRWRRRGFQARDADARHLPRLGGGRGARLCAACAGGVALPRARAPDVRWRSRGSRAHAGAARRHGDRGRRRGAPHLSRRMAGRRAEDADDEGSGDGQDERDRIGAAGDRRRRAAFRGPRRDAWAGRRAPVP